MEKKTKKFGKTEWMMVAGIGVVIIVLITFALINFSKGKEEDKNNEDITKAAEVEGLKIDKIKLTTKDNQATYEADVTNTTDKVYPKDSIDIILKDKDDKIIISLLGYLGENTKAGETKHIKATTAMDLTDNIVKKIEYKIHEEKIVKDEE